jgi:hypothetical protein
VVSCYVWIGLNESQEKTALQRVQLPEALLQEGNERVVGSGLFLER